MLTLYVTIVQRWHGKVIQSLADDTTERVWNREKAPRLGAEIQRVAQKKLRQLYRICFVWTRQGPADAEIMDCR